MATLNTSNGQFAQTFTVNQQAGSYILLSTANKYVDKDIKITTNVKLATTTANTASADITISTADGSKAGVNIASIIGTKTTTEPSSGYYVAFTATGSGSSKVTEAGWVAAGILPEASTTSNIKYFPIPTATLTFSGGILDNKDATAVFANTNNQIISTSSTDAYNNGLSILAQASANRTAVTYTNTAGYIPAHTSAQTAAAATTVSSWDGDTYYLTGVTLAAPESGIAKFDITVPNGNTTDFITFQFSVDSAGNVTVAGPD